MALLVVAVKWCGVIGAFASIEDTSQYWAGTRCVRNESTRG